MRVSSELFDLDGKNIYKKNKKSLKGKWLPCGRLTKEDLIKRGEFCQDFFVEDLFKRPTMHGDILVASRKAKANTLGIYQAKYSTKNCVYVQDMSKPEQELKRFRATQFINITDQLAANSRRQEAMLTKDVFLEKNI